MGAAVAILLCALASLRSPADDPDLALMRVGIALTARPLVVADVRAAVAAADRIGAGHADGDAGRARWARVSDLMHETVDAVFAERRVAGAVAAQGLAIECWSVVETTWAETGPAAP